MVKAKKKEKKCDKRDKVDPRKSGANIPYHLATTTLRSGTSAKKRKKRKMDFSGFLPFDLNSDENGVLSD